MREVPAIYAFNRGIVSPLGLARIDQKRIALSAETQDGFIARVLGSMSFRPGLAYIGATLSNAAARYLKFIFATSDTALVELTDSYMRVWIADALLTRGSVSTAVTNGTFSGNITGWTDGSDAGGSAAWDTGNYLALTSNGTARALAYQLVTVAAPDRGNEHALRIVIDRGPVTLRIGSTLGAEDYQDETYLDPGYHSIAFTPSANFYIQFSSTTAYKQRVKSCTVEASGAVQIPAPWLAADLSYLRCDQSADVIFVACDGYQQRKIERRGTHPGGRSWSVCTYQTEDGPFLVRNVGPITLSATATTGDTTVTASQPLFKSSQVGALFSLTSSGQEQTATIAAQNTFTASIKVTGIGDQRSFGITIAGTLLASTVTLQSSTDDATWNDAPNETFTSTTTTAYSDGLDNQTIYYRIGIKTGAYGGADSATCTLIFNGGVQTGVVRITAFISSTQVSAQVLSALGSTSATDNWAEGSWSSYMGYPTCARIYEGRLWWFGRNGIWGSVSDAYTSFDADTLGDSAPINRTIGSGPVDVINFALALQRLVIGSEGKEISIRSSALDTPLTATDFTMKDASTQGSAKVEAWKIDQRGIYVQRGGIRVYEVGFDMQTFDYNSTDLTQICPELGSPGIVRVDVQRQPDTRIHAVRSDGTVMIGTYDKNEDVLAWQTFPSTGTVEDVVVLPSTSGSTEDQVYYVVNRTVNGSTVRYLEKWALETECRGGTLSKNMDAHITFTQASSTTISGLTHLIGESVVVWHDGAPELDANNDPKTFTVSAGGAITVGTAAVTGVVGLAYTAQWKSAKLGLQASALQTTLTEHKRIVSLGLVLDYWYPGCLKYGSDFTLMRSMPKIEEGTTISGTQGAYESHPYSFPVKWTEDLRLCLQAQSPLPVTILAAIPEMEIHA